MSQTSVTQQAAKPKILIACYRTGGGSGAIHGSTPGGDVLGCAMTEDGCVLAEHLSSSESYCEHDMGITSEWKHDRYREKYPGGFELVWIGVEHKTDSRWQAALAKNRAFVPVEEAETRTA